MGRVKPSLVPKERRVSSHVEAVLGYGKKQNVDESRRCPQCAQPTCRSGCPLGVDIPGFIRHLREDDAASALERILKNNPFPAICGRICPAPCQDVCVFHDEGAALSIRQLERYAADNGRVKPSKDKQPVIKSNGRKIAIVGSGPAGMSAAHVFASHGFEVTIFEAMGEPGGLLRYGIPEYRLPQKVLDDQFQTLTQMRVVLKTNILVGSTISIREIFAQGHEALLLTIGAAVPKFSLLPGHNLGGVYYATEILHRIQGLSKVNPQGSGIFGGNQSVVVGRGHAALDVARLCRRFGQEVSIIFEGLEEQMGIDAEEMVAAHEEGVSVIAPAKVLSLVEDNHANVRLITYKMLEVSEEAGRLDLKESLDGAKELVAQTVILSTGRQTPQALRHHLPQLRFNEDLTLWTDPSTGKTNLDNIYAAGNCAHGAGMVVDAIKNGQDIARKMMEAMGV